MEIARTILAQLGTATLAMLGVKTSVAHPRGVMVHIQGSKKCNRIFIELSPLDTYDVKFMKYNPRKFDFATVAEYEGIHADQLHTLIEETTGLYTRL
jgi:hypothetical protein